MEKNQGRKEIAIFFVLLIFLTTIVYFWMFGSGGKGELPSIVMMWVPGIAALLTLAICRLHLGELGWRAGKLRDWALALAFPILVSLIAYGSMWLSGAVKFYPDEVVNYRWIRMLGFQTPASFYLGVLSKAFLASLMELPFVLGEEIGWSGFLVPRLRKIFSVPATSIIVGIIWSLWYYPAIIGGFYYVEAPLWIALPGFSLVLTGASFFRTVLVSRSRSLWPGVILNISNYIFLMGMFYDMTRKSEYSSWLVSKSGLFLAPFTLPTDASITFLPGTKLKKKSKKGSATPWSPLGSPWECWP